MERKCFMPNSNVDKMLPLKTACRLTLNFQQRSIIYTFVMKMIELFKGKGLFKKNIIFR